jgi:hypothetical protein
MMPKDWLSGVVLLCVAMTVGLGCRKDPLPVSEPPDAGASVVSSSAAMRPDAGPVAKGKKRLKFSDVALKTQFGRLDVTFTLTNPGSVQGRGDACLALLDAKGVVIVLWSLGNVTVKGGMDDVFENAVQLPGWALAQARTALLYTAAESQCAEAGFSEASEPERLLLTGGPAPAKQPAPRRSKPAAKGDLSLSDVQLTHEEGADYTLTYTLKNTSGRRLNGATCLKAYEEDNEDEEVFFVQLSEWSQPAGDKETRTDRISIDDSRDWDAVGTLDLIAGDCGAVPEQAPAHLRFHKSEMPGTPEAPESEGVDESTGPAPGEEAFGTDGRAMDDDSPGN